MDREKMYDLDFKNPNSDKSKWLPSDKLQELYESFIKEFPIVSIEDPFDQDHWEAWTSITAKTNIQVCPIERDIFKIKIYMTLCLGI